MSIDRKISPAFKPFLARSGDHDRRDAIVIYQTPGIEGIQVGDRLGQLNRRQLNVVREQTQLQREVEGRLFESYQGRSLDMGHEGAPLQTRTIGAGTLPMANVEVTRTTLAALASEPDVVAVLPNQNIELLKPKQIDYTDLLPQEQEGGLTWGLKQLDIAKVWETTKGAGINVAVLDTGCYGDHPALKGRVQDFVLVDPLGRRITTDVSFDAGQHGTHICGTIAGGMTEDGIAIGCAPEANLLVGGVLVGNATLLTLVEGMAWAIERGADIINLSLGLEYYEPLFSKVLDILISQYDVLPVVAIGNSNHGNTSSPGNSYNAFSVGAIEQMAEDQLGVTFFSSGASLVFPGQSPEEIVTKPDVVAPGAQVYSCIPPEQRPDGTFAYTYMDGTSMAAPHISGVAALLMAANPEASATDVLKALRESALHPNGSERRPDNRWGYGLIQPAEALKLIQMA